MLRAGPPDIVVADVSEPQLCTPAIGQSLDFGVSPPEMEAFTISTKYSSDINENTAPPSSRASQDSGPTVTNVRKWYPEGGSGTRSHTEAGRSSSDFMWCRGPDEGVSVIAATDGARLCIGPEKTADIAGRIQERVLAFGWTGAAAMARTPGGGESA